MNLFLLKTIDQYRESPLIAPSPIPLFIQEVISGTSMDVQWLGLWAFTVKGPGSIPGQGSKIPQAVQCGQKQINKMKALISS